MNTYHRDVPQEFVSKQFVWTTMFMRFGHIAATVCEFTHRISKAKTNSLNMFNYSVVVPCRFIRHLNANRSMCNLSEENLGHIVKTCNFTRISGSHHAKACRPNRKTDTMFTKFGDMMAYVLYRRAIAQLTAPSNERPLQ